MSGSDWVALVALGGAGALAVEVVRTRARVRRLERTTLELDALVRGDLEPRIAAAGADARAAGATARDAAIAAGITTTPPRLPLESMTGPVVRVVAFSASARRALARVATPGRVLRRDQRRSA